MSEAALPDAPSQPGGPGSELTAARERLGLTIAEAASQLKLSLRQVEALETDNYERLPGDVFVRGFLRSYARLLGIDQTSVIRSAETILAPPPTTFAGTPGTEVPFPAPRSTRWAWYLLALSAVVLPLLIYEAFFAVPRDLAMKAMDPPLVAPVSLSAPNTTPSTDAAASVNEAPALSEASQAPLPPPALPVAPETSRQISFRFARDSWVEVRDSQGRVSYSRLGKAGTEQMIEVTIPASFVIGNAADVRMAYGDKEYDLSPHIKVSVARFTLE